MGEISSAVIHLLVGLGRVEDIGDPAAKPIWAELGLHDQVNRESPAGWHAACESLSLEDHEALIRGLVLAEESLSWLGGSVAGAIWVFRSFVQRAKDRRDELASWCLTHTSNYYVPFGTYNHGARTMEEYETACAREFELRNYRHEEIKKAEQEAREWRATRKAQVERACVKRKNGYRKSFLEELQAKNLSEQISLAAFDCEYPINWYPTRVAGACRGEVLAALEPEIRAALLERLRGKQHVPWLVLKKRIRAGRE
jgi:hypothetical protein